MNTDQRPGLGHRAIPRALVILAVSLAAVLVGCGGDRQPETLEIVVPAGTQQRLTAGEDVEVMPARLELRVGDTLLIRNEDSVTQSVGPYMVKANGQIRLTYGVAGRFEGYCPLSAGDRYEIIVEE